MGSKKQLVPVRQSGSGLLPAMVQGRRQAFCWGLLTQISGGSVAIAGSQTAVYPHETPGGWHLVGSTELLLFDPERDRPSLLRAGHRVRFERIA